MPLLFDLEALARDGGLAALQTGQRDFSPYVFHFTSYKAMEAVRDRLTRVGRGEPGASDFVDLLQSADVGSAESLRAILSTGVVEARKFHKDYRPAVCLTECTLAGVLTHSSRYGRYGLLFRKEAVFEHGGRPVAYVTEDVRNHYIELASKDARMQQSLLHVTSLIPQGTGRQVQDFTHEREWRCPSDVPTSLAVALVVATLADYADFAPLAKGIPVIPLELLYQLGL